MDRKIARVVFAPLNLGTSTLCIGVASLAIYLPLAVIYEAGLQVLLMTFILAVVAATIVIPFSWLRDSVYLSNWGQRRFAHHVRLLKGDKAEKRIEHFTRQTDLC
jgi:hypothetical protein